nr:uncharacterized protein LOC107457258 [Parasteatoda tepidariorum]
MERPAKKAKVTQRYRDAYSVEWPCFIKSKVSEGHVFCTVCSTDFMIAHGGRDDCRRHFQSKKHRDLSKLREQSSSLDTYFRSSQDTDATKAEMLFAAFIIEHNLPISCSDHASQLFQNMFPDSKIAKKYSSSRTKTSSIIKAMAKHSQEYMIQILKQSPFSLATDGSNDVNSTKLYPVVLSYFDESSGKIDTVLFSILPCSDNTGAGIFDVLNKEFQNKNIPWSNCVSFACDNTNTMIGHLKGVVSFIKKEQPNIVIQGCSCHYIHLAAKKGTAELKQVNVEQFLIQLYYFLDKSSKRKHSFKLCQELFGTKPHKIFKYVSTRWLSLLDCINRVLEQWDPLVEFCSKSSDCESLRVTIQNPMLKLYCLFLSNTLPLFNKVNVTLQQEAPAIHVLQKNLTCLFMDLLSRFIKPPQSDKCLSSVLDIDFESKKFQKRNEDLVIGIFARTYITEKKFSSEQLEKFYADVREFYKTACCYIKKKLPLENEMLKHAEVANIHLKTGVSFSSVLYFADRFRHMFSDEEYCKLEEEFASYQFQDFSNINLTRMDCAWNEISKLTDGSGVKKFAVLPKLMLLVLLVPHSNAYTERVFSIVRKNQNDFRPNLGTETLSSLLIEKTKALTNKKLCFERKFSDAEIRAAKQSTKLDLHITDK